MHLHDAPLWITPTSTASAACVSLLDFCQSTAGCMPLHVHRAHESCNLQLRWMSTVFVLVHWLAVTGVSCTY
jgi:hypothetical protein